MRMFYRQRVLLKVLSLLPVELRKDAWYGMKTMFLLNQEEFTEQNQPYKFHPYQYGPFSSVMYEDLRFFYANGLVDEFTMAISPKAKPFFSGVGSGLITRKVGDILARFKTPQGLIDYVYDKYPAFTVRSVLRPQKRVCSPGLSAIGYEGDTIDSFLNKLIQGNVDVLVDVRKNAFSMKTHFRKQALEHALEKSGIGYLHLPALGIDSDKRQNLDTPADYKRLFEEYRAELPAKENELNQLLELSKTKRLALMCFERDPQSCHRGVLAEKMAELGQRVEFI